MFSTFGTLFRVTTFGESHCAGVGAVVDGCPPRLALCEADIQPQLDRRRPGQSRLTTDRDEADRVTILSGTENGLTLGTPIALLVHNRDQRPGDYAAMQPGAAALPRRLHLPREVRHPRGKRRRPLERARDHRPRGGRRRRREAAAGAVRGARSWPGSAAVGEIDAPELEIESHRPGGVDGAWVRCPHAVRPSA